MYGVYSQQASGGVIPFQEVIIIGGSNNRIFRSTDDGVSFSEQTVPHPSIPTFAVAWRNVFYCNGKFFISGMWNGSGYGTMVSHDYGLTWVNISNQAIESIVWNGTYYFAGFNKQIRRSANLTSWTNLTLQGENYQSTQDLCVDNNNNVYWSSNKWDELGLLLGIQKCVAPYNSENISLIGAPNPSSIPNETRGTLYKTSNGLILGTYGSVASQRIYSTVNYTSLVAASSSYVITGYGTFDIVVGAYAYKFGTTSDVIKGRGTPIIAGGLSSTTHPNNGRATSIDTDGTTFVTKSSTGSGGFIWTRAVTANTSTWTSTAMGFIPTSVFYTGMSFLVMNATNVRRSVTGTSGWSTATTPFGGNSYNDYGNRNIASSYKV